jgi:hypothetical protein
LKGSAQKRYASGALQRDYSTANDDAGAGVRRCCPADALAEGAAHDGETSNSGIKGNQPVIYELRTYTLLPGKLGDYLKLAANVESEVFGGDNDKFGKFEGQWFTEFGTLNQAIILVRYRDLNERDFIRSEPFKSQEWLRFTQKIVSTPTRDKVFFSNY